ncbi:comm domain-containing protein [Anaeramoeba flamelloides]|uniref:Comm domain-containing protein n=1 Tax=Anaeramoeba flamelloides TaxID=1746091 RepID=A0ABQ8Y6I1_9EUKA|nr:comm domain-containing protein [Anaeramoeba flamelloides]
MSTTKSKFKFTNESVDPQMISDMDKFSELSDEIILSVCDSIFKLFTNTSLKITDSIEKLAKIYSLNSSALTSPFRGALFFFNLSLKKKLMPSSIKKDLETFGLSEDISQKISDQWKKNFLSLSRIIGHQTLNVNRLIDMDWRFGVTASSDDLSSIGSTYLQLKFIIDNESGQSNKKYEVEGLHVELDLPQFYDFLTEMQKANNTLQLFLK